MKKNVSLSIHTVRVHPEVDRGEDTEPTTVPPGMLDDPGIPK